jgi:hypothetical protein
MPNSASGNSDISLPRSRAQRLREYRRRFPGPDKRFHLRVSRKRVHALVKRGYLGANERDDDKALGQALSLFMWDALVGDRASDLTKGGRRVHRNGQH